MTFEHEVCV